MEGAPRSYRCLACDDRPVIEGKLRAHIHCTKAHGHLLASHHVDELLEELSQHGQLTIYDEIPDTEGPIPPFHCLHCRAIGKPVTRSTFDSIKLHLDATHNIYQPLFGADYEDEGVLIERKMQEDALIDRYAEAVHSLRGVADFLTECDA